MGSVKSCYSRCPFFSSESIHSTCLSSQIPFVGCVISLLCMFSLLLILSVSSTYIKLPKYNVVDLCHTATLIVQSSIPSICLSPQIPFYIYVVPLPCMFSKILIVDAVSQFLSYYTSLSWFASHRYSDCSVKSSSSVLYVGSSPKKLHLNSSTSFCLNMIYS